MFLALIVIIVVAVAGVAAYLALSSGSSSSTTVTSSTPTQSATGTTTASSSQPSTTSSSPTTTSSTAATTTSSTVPPTTSSTTSSAGSTTSSYTCTTSTATSTGQTVDYTPQYINLIKTFSAMNFQASEENTTSGQTNNSTLSYGVTSSNGGIYDVNFTVATTSGSESFGASVDANNNTVLSVTISGSPIAFTGTQAKQFFDEFMALFGLEETYSGEYNTLTDLNYFHSTGTASQTFGTTSFDVTTWVANNLPETYSGCGFSGTISDYTLKVGTPPGTSLNFITYLHFVETAPDTENITFQLVSMTVG